MKTNVGNDSILQLEEKISFINRRLFHVPGVTNLSFDEDHLRVSSNLLIS